MYLLLLATALVSRAEAIENGVPVIILDGDSTLQHLTHDMNPFLRLPPHQFVDIVFDCVNRTDVIVIFVEQTLSIEDLAIRDHAGTAFPEMQALLTSKRAKYYPSVDDPFKYLSQIFELDKDNVFDITNTSASIRVFPNDLKNFYIIFVDTAERDKRVGVLRRHDRIISDVYAAVREFTKGHVAALYTGKKASRRLAKRTFAPIVKSQGDGNVIAKHPVGLFYFQNIVLVQGGVKTILKQVPGITETNWTMDGVVANIRFEGPELRFKFRFESYHWYVDEVEMYVDGKLEGSTPMFVVAPWGSSYACADPVYINGRKLELSIYHYQIQVFRPPEKPAPKDDAALRKSGDRDTFGPAELCTVLVTAPVLMGLLVVFIMLGILSAGVVMMLDLRAYDRFDDPHGKPFLVTFHE